MTITEGGVQPPGFTTKRTESMPKATLFGSMLEMQDEESAKSVRSLDPSKVKLPRTPPVKGKGQQFVLPEDVKRGLPQAAVLDRSKEEFGLQKSRANAVINDLRQKEEEILYKRTQVGDQTARSSLPDTSRSQWFTERDLEGSEQINVVGLNKNQSYNRDKYGQRAPVHNYSLIGDVLRPGMDFPRRERTDIQMRNLGFGKGDMKGPLADGFKATPRTSGVASAGKRAPVTLPPNIKHQFGSRVCDKLLSDQDAVEKTIKKQNELKTSSQRPSKPYKVATFTKEMNPEYEMLGNALRMNVVPGYSIDQKVSTTKTAFNDQVHLFRYRDPDQYRYQKDELNTWTEQQFLYMKLSKQWKDLLENLPKYKPNWPTDAKPKSAPVTISKPEKKTPKPKQRQQPPKKKEEQKNPKADFPEVEFVTPPVTPPPEKVQLKPRNSKDKEFWEFYEKGVS